MSVVEIKHPETMVGNLPKEEGLLDTRMGTVDKAYYCYTCDGKMNECPGHFGHIKLSKPMFHMSYISSIIKVLQCVCYNCGKLLGDEV